MRDRAKVAAAMTIEQGVQMSVLHTPPTAQDGGAA
jgi:hypothetical protein